MDAFAALGDPVRRDLVARLSRGPARVVDLAADHAISRPAISRHLRLLTEAGLVVAQDRGRERHYRLQRSGLDVVTDWLAALQPPTRFAASMLDGLDFEVRRTTRERTADRPGTTDRTDTEETA